MNYIRYLFRNEQSSITFGILIGLPIILLVFGEAVYKIVIISIPLLGFLVGSYLNYRHIWK